MPIRQPLTDEARAELRAKLPLSWHQAEILRVALEARGEKVTPCPRCGPRTLPAPVDAYYSELLARVWGLPLSVESSRLIDPEWAGHGVGCECLWRGKNFDAGAIGGPRYRCAKTSMQRAVTRLEVRGLVRVLQGVFGAWSGVVLTPAGEAVLAGGAMLVIDRRTDNLGPLA